MSLAEVIRADALGNSSRKENKDALIHDVKTYPEKTREDVRDSYFKIILFRDFRLTNAETAAVHLK